jgi:hypothetical protein
MRKSPLLNRKSTSLKLNSTAYLVGGMLMTTGDKAFIPLYVSSTSSFYTFQVDIFLSANLSNSDDYFNFLTNPFQTLIGWATAPQTDKDAIYAHMRAHTYSQIEPIIETWDTEERLNEAMAEATDEVYQSVFEKASQEWLSQYINNHLEIHEGQVFMQRDASGLWEAPEDLILWDFSIATVEMSDEFLCWRAWLNYIPQASPSQPIQTQEQKNAQDENRAILIYTEPLPAHINPPGYAHPIKIAGYYDEDAPQGSMAPLRTIWYNKTYWEGGGGYPDGYYVSSVTVNLGLENLWMINYDSGSIYDSAQESREITNPHYPDWHDGDWIPSSIIRGFNVPIGTGLWSYHNETGNPNYDTNYITYPRRDLYYMTYQHDAGDGGASIVPALCALAWVFPGANLLVPGLDSILSFGLREDEERS